MRYVSTRGQRTGAGLRRRAAGRVSPPTAGSTSRRSGRRCRRCDPSAGYAAAAAAVMAPFVGDEIDRAVLDAIAPTPTRCRTRVPPSGRLPARAARPRRVAARALPRADARLQGRRPAARRPAVRPRAGGAGRAGHDRRRDQRRHRRGGDRRLAGRTNVDIVILYPEGRVSEVQRRQMTTVDGGERAGRRRRGHVRRLPGPREGDVQRRRLPRPAPPVGRELDQLGPRDGADRLLRRRPRRRSAGGRCRSPCRPATSATSSRAGSPGAWERRSTVS